MDIQAAIDALPTAGGVVLIPAGDHRADSPASLLLRSNVRLVGAGMGLTTIPRIAGVSGRIYNVGLEDLSVICSGGYAIDWRGVTSGSIKRVIANGGDYGLLGLSDCYYNVFENLFISAANTGVEFSGNANQNTFIGGKISAPIMVAEFSGCNGNTWVGTSLELGVPVSQITWWKKASGGGLGSRMVNVRREAANFGPDWLN